MTVQWARSRHATSQNPQDSQIRLVLIQDAGWIGGQHAMGRPYSLDLRERVVAAVEKGGLSCNRAAAQFGLGISTVINWVRRVRETGSVAPGQMGGHKPKAISGEHREWLLQRVREKDFTIRGLVAEFAERGLKVDYRSGWNFIHAEKLSFKKKHGRQRTRSSRHRAPTRAMGKVSGPH